MKKALIILLIAGGTALAIAKGKKNAAPQGETPEQKAARLKAEADMIAARTAYMNRMANENIGQFQTLVAYDGVPRDSYFGAVYVNDANGNKGVYYTENGKFFFIPISDVKIIKEPGFKDISPTDTKRPTDDGGVTTGGSGGFGISRRPSLFFR